MKKAHFVFLIVLLLAFQCSAQNIESLTEDFQIPFQVSLDNVPNNLEVEMVVVYGEGVDSFEQMMVDSLTANPPSLKSASALVNGQQVTKEVKVKTRFVSENNVSLDELSKITGIVILVGGETHNNLTKEAYVGNYITNESVRFSGKLTVASGKIGSASLMILKHNIANESERLEREAVNYSPLRFLVPEAYVPVVATGIGMFLMSFLNIFKAIIESLTGEIGKRKMTYDHTGKRILGVQVKEAFALITASLVLGFAVTWTFAGPTQKFLDLILMNSAICLIAGLSHDLIHRILCKLFKIKVEYRLWYAGSFITILTAFLGNSFGMQGFLLEKPNEEISKWKYGLMKLAAPLFSIGVAGIFASLYLKNPSVLYQMIFSTASLIAMAEIMPAKGLDGYDIREWNRWIYLIIFMGISSVFFAINFVQ